MRLRTVTAPMMVCTGDGDIVELSRAGADVLANVGIDAAAGLPRPLRKLLEAAPLGQSFEWYPMDKAITACLGLTCYDGGEAGRLVIMRELTSVRRALAQRLYEQRISAMGNLARGLAHDLRNALASVIINTEILGEHVEKAQAHERQRLEVAIEEIERAAARMNDLVDALLNNTQLGSGEHSVMALADVFGRVAGLMAPRLRDSGHRIDVKVGPEAARARGNPLLLEEALVLLVEHALDATRAATSTVSLATSRMRDEVCISIAFEGGGSASAGDWMALPMAREAVSLFGGRMSVQIGNGSPRVELWLPACRSS